MMVRMLYCIFISFFKRMKALLGKIIRRQDTVSYTLELVLYRIRRVLDGSGMRRKRGAEGVWITKAEKFVDAYRLMLRLCSPRYVRCVRQAGHICYKIQLPDSGGSILLHDRTGNRKGTVAVMIFSVRQLPDIKEIRFSSIEKSRS